MVKKADVIIVSAVLLFVCFFFSGGFLQKEKSDGKIISIYIDGKKEYSYDLSKKKHDVIKIDNKYGYNEIVFENGSVYMENADCSGRDCIKTGSISDINDFIICAPHKLMIKIEKTAGDDDVSAVTY